MTSKYAFSSVLLLATLAFSAGCVSILKTSYRPTYTPTYSNIKKVPVAIGSVSDKRSTKPTVYYQKDTDTGQFDRPVADIVREAVAAELQRAGLTLADETASTAIVSCEVLDLKAGITELFLRSPTLDLAVVVRFEWKDAKTKIVLGTNERSERRSRDLGFWSHPYFPDNYADVLNYGKELINDMLPRVIEKEFNSTSFLQQNSR